MSTDKQLTVWRMTNFFVNRNPPAHGSLVQSIEKTFVYTAVPFALGYIAGSLASWVPLPGIPLPLPSPEATGIDSNYLTHLGFWIRNGIHALHFDIEFDFGLFDMFQGKGFHVPHLYTNIYQQSHDNYAYYKELLESAGYGYTVWLRQLLATAVGAGAGFMGFNRSLKNPIEATPITHKRGIRLLKGNEAVAELKTYFEREARIAKPKGNYAELAKGVMWPLFRFVTHSMIVGAAGTGKSQLLVSMIESAMAMGLKLFLLDPKYEFTKGYYDEKTCAILDPSDSRSWIWDIATDLKNLSDIKKFAAAIIPSKGNDPMWSNAARAVLTGMIVYLRDNIVDEFGNACYTWEDLSDMITLKPSQLVHIMEKCHPEALLMIANISEETGEIETNATSFGIMVNLLAFMGGVRDLSRFWHNKNAKKLSLYRFMTDPDYEVKTIFAKPNDTEAEMNAALFKAALTFTMSLVDSPALSESSVPKIAFYLDEVHSVGKLENEIGQPLISRAFDRGRSKGISMNITCQSLYQLYELYNEKIVDGWKEASSNFYVTGTPLGKTADALAGALGERAIDKTSTSTSTSKDSTSSSTQTQQHMDKIMFSSEFSTELVLTETGIKFYYQGRGLPNVYIVDKPFVTIPDYQPHWLEQKQKRTAVNNDSRVVKLINKEKLAKEKETANKDTHHANNNVSPQSAIDRFVDLKQECADQDNAPPAFNDYGQYADEEIIDTEAIVSKKFVKEYDITPDKEDEDSLEVDMVKDHLVELMTDSHAINAIRQIWELLSSNSNKRVKTTDYKEKVKFEQKKRYGNSYSGIELKREKETQ